MDTRRALDSTAIGSMMVICLLWGLQQVVLKATAHDIAPILQIGLRSGVAALLVWMTMALRGERMRITDGTLGPGLVVGGLFALEFLLVGEGLRHTNASHMAVFLYTAPIFAALGLHWKLPSERLGAVQWLGIALAFGGIAMTFLGRSQGTGSSKDMADMLWGDFLGLLAGVAWAATTLVVRTTTLARAPATQTLMYQLVAAAVLLLMASLVTGQTHFNPTPQVWLSLAFHSLVVSFASFLATTGRFLVYDAHVRHSFWRMAAERTNRTQLSDRRDSGAAGHCAGQWWALVGQCGVRISTSLLSPLKNRCLPLVLGAVLLCAPLLATSEVSGKGPRIFKSLQGGTPTFSDVPPAKGAYVVYRPSCYACGVSSNINWNTTKLNLDAYADEIGQAARQFDLDPALLRAVIHAESNFNASARSQKGARGLMQLMPGTARMLGVAHASDPAHNIRGGAQYLAGLLARFKNDVTLAAAAYNAGPEAVQKYAGVPPYAETQVYVQRVKILFQRYRNSLRG